MVAPRIIPCLDIDQSGVVKGVRFKNLRSAGNPVEVASRYNLQGADEIVVLDIAASHEGRDTLLEVIRDIAGQVFIPLTVGGGVRCLEDIEKLLQNGADKVGINSAAVLEPELVRRAAERFGKQCIVVAIDAKREDDSRWKVYTHGGREKTDLDAVEWAKQACSLGAGEILLTSMDRDGTGEGFDLELTREVSRAVSVPVIASGGVGRLRDFVDGIVQGEASAVLAAGVFHDSTYTISDVKERLEKEGIEVRKVGSSGRLPS